MSGWLFGVDITEGAKTYIPTWHQPFEQFSPAYQLDYSYAPSVFIDSPGSKGATITTKKEARQTPTIEGSEVTAPTTGQPQDWTGTVLILGVVGVVGYIIASGLKKKK